MSIAKLTEAVSDRYSCDSTSYDEAVTACTVAWLVLQGQTRQLADELGVNLAAAARRAL